MSESASLAKTIVFNYELAKVMQSNKVVNIMYTSMTILALIMCCYFKLATGDNLEMSNCPLWHVRKVDKCVCGDVLYGNIECDGTDSIIVAFGGCMTWDNISQRAVFHRCPLSHKITCPNYRYFGSIEIPTNFIGAILNDITCKIYNRQGTHCEHCRNGYGPAPFSDGFTCADCSEQRHLWILNLFFQLSMVTVMYLFVVLFQIKGTSSPLNVIITYSQLCVCPISLSVGVRVRMSCFLGPTLSTVVMTIIGVTTLDFFRFILPPMCVSTFLKSIDIILFDYIIALYPIVLTFIIYICIELHDRNYRIAVYLSIPLKRIFKLFNRNWNPKTTILNTCMTFILLAYSKFLFTSTNLLFGVKAYYSDGNIIPNSTVLLYDPTVKFFHSQHIPYAVFALFIIIVFVLLPPLLLLLYPTRLFKKCLNCCRFQRWDILQVVADIFQGWYKDGTEGTRDFRAVSALYFLLRIMLSSVFILLMFVSYNPYGWYTFGLFHIFLGVFFFVAKPYKKNWMNYIDGLLILWIGVLVYVNINLSKSSLIVGILFGPLLCIVSFLLKYIPKRVV